MLTKSLLTIFFVLVLVFSAAAPTVAMGFGFHLLHPEEIKLAAANRNNSEEFFVTVPFALNDRREAVWNEFFRLAQENRITPLVRLVTQSDNHIWPRPTKRQIVDAANFFRRLNWPGPRYIIVFNEPNHANEWGGEINPDDYAKTALFVASWLKTEPYPYVILPAGLDAAAPNGPDTRDSFVFLEQMLNAEPDFLESFDGWTSHSYPNPDFTAPPYRTGKNSLRGFESELNFLRRYGKGDLPVYITETGWRATKSITPRLKSYYQTAVTKIWNHPQVKAVTVFVLQGNPGPFKEFSLLNSDNSPSLQLNALNQVIKNLD